MCLLNGILSAKAISTIVNFLIYRDFLYLSGAILAVNLIWYCNISNSKASESYYKKCTEIRKDIVKSIESGAV